MLNPHMEKVEDRLDRSELAQYRRRDMTPQGVESGNPIGYEHGDANIRGVVTAVLIVFGSVLIIALMIAGAFSYFNARENRLKEHVFQNSPLIASQPMPPAAAPKLLPSPLEGDNALPWDKMEQERKEAEDTANAQPGFTRKGAIPVKDAMTQIAKENGDTQGEGTPAHSTLTVKSPYYPQNYKFERSDEKMNMDSSGGRKIDQNPLAPSMRAQREKLPSVPAKNTVQ
jgi:hypothetical protein